ncbi:MAG: hypothetical protein K2X38_14355 [Gemmataceae bacterium]|nr:hypothetical protein [Gemmataceae bacterium]
MFINKSRLATAMMLAISPIVAWAGEAPVKGKTADELSPAKFEKLHALIKPDPKISFERIPWLTSLWAARQKAAAEDKPIVLWSGDPLPLGVT